MAKSIAYEDAARRKLETAMNTSTAANFLTLEAAIADTSANT